MVAIIYGSSTLNTEYVAQRIAETFGSATADLHNVKDLDPGLILERSSLVCISSTWGRGDLQDDWELFLPRIEPIDFTGKTVALVGVGDQVNYPDAFCDSLRILYDFVIDRGAAVVGETSTEGYKFRRSRAERDGRFLGLILDEDSQAGRSGERISRWVRTVRPLLTGPGA